MSRDTIHELKTKIADVAHTYSAFKKLADDLELSVPERLKILGGMSPTTYRRRLNGMSASFKPEEERRLALFFEIYQEAGYFGDSKRWLRGNHRAPVFKGKSPLALMLRGTMKGLEQTYNHLRDLSGGWA